MPDFESRMAALRERFLVQARAEAAAVVTHAHNVDHVALRDLCHGLAGRAGMFGFRALGDAARGVEEAIDAGFEERALAPLIAQLRDELVRLP